MKRREPEITIDSLIEYTKQAVCDPASKEPVAHEIWNAIGFSIPPDAAQIERLKRMSDAWWEALYIGRMSLIMARDAKAAESAE